MTSDPFGAAADLSFEQKLANYASLLVRVGVNLQPGGKLQVNAPIEAAELVRLIVRDAWEVGAVAVDVNYIDPHLTRLMYDHAPEAALDYAPAWEIEREMHQIDEGYSFLNVAGRDPDLLAGADQERIARHSKVMATLSRPVAEREMAFEINWSVGAMPVPSWPPGSFRAWAPSRPQLSSGTRSLPSAGPTSLTRSPPGGRIPSAWPGYVTT